MNAITKLLLAVTLQRDLKGDCVTRNDPRGEAWHQAVIERLEERIKELQDNKYNG